MASSAPDHLRTPGLISNRPCYEGIKFVFLAKEGYYNDTTFYRVIPGFMAQGGDPTGTGRGGPGYTFEDEFSVKAHDAGVLSMANAGPNTNGSQFFITYEAQHHLDGKHTVFGRVVDGMEFLLSLTPRDPTANPSYAGDRITRITIRESEAERVEEPVSADSKADAEPPSPEADAIAQLAVADLAERLGISPSAITIVSVEAVDWPDTSLGNPQPGMFYAQVITPGYKILLSANDQLFEYHTDRQRVSLVN